MRSMTNGNEKNSRWSCSVTQTIDVLDCCIWTPLRIGLPWYLVGRRTRLCLHLISQSIEQEPYYTQTLLLRTRLWSCESLICRLLQYCSYVECKNWLNKLRQQNYGAEIVRGRQVDCTTDKSSHQCGNRALSASHHWINASSANIVVVLTWNGWEICLRHRPT
jgi:hypothetical protein